RGNGDPVRGAVIGSGVVHLLLLAVLLIVRPPRTFVVPGPDVIQVSLLDMPAATIATPPAPPPEVKQKPTPIQPTEEEGVKLEPPKPKAKPKPQPAKQRAPQPTTVAAALPYASVGPSGLKGSVTLDSNFEFTYYLTLVRNRIAQSWTPPTG